MADDREAEWAVRGRPAVVTCFLVYCVVLCVLYLATAAFSLVFFLADPADPEMPRPVALILGALLLGMGLVLFAGSALPLVLRPRPWLWTYNLVLICVGMTSPCFLPVCIPLLLYWMKPEAKAYYGKA